MPELYLKQMEFKKKIKNLSKKINFYPEFSRKILNDWIDSISMDWPISRRRFYATEVPLWYFEDFVAVPKPGNYYQPWKESVPKNADIFKNGKKVGDIKEAKFKDLKWEGEKRVFDTWMDSSISDFYITKYKTDDNLFKKAYPVTLRPQGKEIVRTWLYYTLLRGFLETGKMSFEDVWIHQHVLDDKGRKMSKSLGNRIDPQELLRDHGAEAIRMWSAIEGDLSKQDIVCSRERISAELKTINKILNVSKFVMLFDKPKVKPNLTELDGLFIDYVENLTDFCDKSYNSYDFYNPAIKLRKFLWDTFASHYVELVKARAYNSEEKFNKNESDSAKYALHFLLERFLNLIYPIIPQVTTTIAMEKNIDLLKEKWPKTNKVKSDLTLVDEIIEFNSSVWKKKKEKGISLRNEISGIKIPKKLGVFTKDLKRTHNLL